MKEKAAKYCNENPLVTEIFVTADGFLFQKEKFAKDHAATLENKETLHYKASASVVVKENENIETGSGASYELTAEDKELLKSGLESKNYQAIKALVIKLDIKTEDLKADTLIEALKNYSVAIAK